MKALLSRLFGDAPPKPGRPLYDAIVASGRSAAPYTHGGVADSVDGRFDMIVLTMSLVLIRLEGEGAASSALRGALIERFIDDMDESVREIGIGDLTVGKEVKKMVGAMSGRLDAYRAALADADEATLREALTRNLYRGETPSTPALSWMSAQVHAAAAALSRLPLTDFEAGQLPVLWQGAAL
jgi:cytochrome b pre-mRNA-processing protein 3